MLKITVQLRLLKQILKLIISIYYISDYSTIKELYMYGNVTYVVYDSYRISDDIYIELSVCEDDKIIAYKMMYDDVCIGRLNVDYDTHKDEQDYAIVYDFRIEEEYRDKKLGSKLFNYMLSTVRDILEDLMIDGLQLEPISDCDNTLDGLSQSELENFYIRKGFVFEEYDYVNDNRMYYKFN